MAVRVRTLLVLPALVLVAACGGDRLTFGEYNEAVADVIGVVDARLDAHAQELFSGSPDLGATRTYLADRVAGYEEMLAGVDALEPPEDAQELHETFVDLLQETLNGERARAEYAATLDAAADPQLIWDSEETAALLATEQRVIDICHAAQDRVDQTQQREGAADMPWIPAEMKEVVRVVFGCPEGSDA